MWLTIPQNDVYALKRGAKDVPAFAAQRACNRMGHSVIEDGDFGPLTEEAMKLVQKDLGAWVDGNCGPGTQDLLSRRIATQYEQSAGLPTNLLLSQIQYESSGYLVIVNWSVPGGVDCGLTQYRILEPDYQNQDAIRKGFDGFYQAAVLSQSTVDRFKKYNARPAVNTRELAYRLAVLEHNYPAAAERISYDGINGLSSYWTTAQSWVIGFNLKFTDGASIRTPLEWCQRYSLGNRNHNEPGQAVKLVQSWG